MPQQSTVLKLLKKKYPNIRHFLVHQDPVQLLVAVILSAQCTDKRVNKVTPQLFKRFKTAKDFAYCSIKELEKYIKSTGFYHNKARNIQGACRIITEQHNGKVPKSMEELTKLPGVGRKTANVVQAAAYGIIKGVTVDTHVVRLSQRLGWSKHKYPEKIEQDLMMLFPKKEWENLSLILISHGRAICNARKPKCVECFLNKLCPSAFKM